MNAHLPLALLAAAVAPSLAAPPTAAEVTGAISAERIRAVNQKLVSFGTRHSLSDPTNPTRGIGAARNWIKAELESYARAGGGTGGMRVAFEEFDAPPSQRIPEGAHLMNIVATIPGTAPGAAAAGARRYYVIGHYDSMPSSVMDPNSDAPGANDDGSGTTTVIEIARVLASRPLESTVVLMCTIGEEQGLIGAKYHADQAAARGDRIMAVLSNDIVGDPLGPGGDPALATPGLIRVFSEGIPRNASAEQLARIRSLAAESDSPSRQLARYIAEVARNENTAVQPMLVFRPDRFLRGGDHSSFNEAGFAAVRFTEVHEDYTRQHQNVRVEKDDQGVERSFGDTLVDYDYLAEVTRLNAAALVHLANAPSPPANVRVITARLAYDTTIRWDRSPETDVAGYEVVWRETTAPEWQGVQDAGDATEFTIAESKDNLFFGVRAYDHDGYRSPVTFAAAARE